MTRKEQIFRVINDLVIGFMYYDRKEDEDLPLGAIEAAIASGELTTNDIVREFKRVLEGGK